MEKDDEYGYKDNFIDELSDEEKDGISKDLYIPRR